MSSLEIKLARVLSRGLDAGGVISRPALIALRAHRATHLRVLWVLILLQLALIGVALGIAWSYADQADVVVAAVGGTGVFGAGAGIGIRRSAAEWSKANLLCILLEEATEAEVRAILGKFLKGMG